MICEKDHGCDPITLPNGEIVSQTMIEAVQKADPRCTVTTEAEATSAMDWPPAENGWIQLLSFLKM